MNELVEVVNNQVVVSSRQVAEKFGKRHADVLRAAEMHDKDLKATDAELRWFTEEYYVDFKGEKRKEYIMNRDGFSLLAMSFNNTRRVLEWKIKYINAFNEMEKALEENEINKFGKIPKTYPEALRKMAEYVEKCEKQEQLLLESKPKVEFFEAVSESNDMLKMAEVAKVLNFKGLGRNRMFEVLREKKILRYNNEPYQAYVDKGYFKQIESKYENEDFTHINLTTVVSQKGLDFIRNVLLKAGYVYLKGGKEIAVNS